MRTIQTGVSSTASKHLNGKITAAGGVSKRAANVVFGVALLGVEYLVRPIHVD